MKKQKNSKYPCDIGEAKEFCKVLCHDMKVKISFDDKYKNFGRTYNQCSSSDNHVECAHFSSFNYDLLIFAVMHELGHIHHDRISCDDINKMASSTSQKNGFACEFEAWEYAINLFNETFGRNISIKQGRYMMDCLNSYLPDYNTYKISKWGISETETSFWCPMKKRVLK